MTEREAAEMSVVSRACLAAWVAQDYTRALQLAEAKGRFQQARLRQIALAESAKGKLDWRAQWQLLNRLDEADEALPEAPPEEPEPLITKARLEELQARRAAALRRLSAGEAR